jgi:hypothetical protein
MCQREGCREAAKFAPKMRVPARGWSLERHKPAEMILGLRLCARHAAAFRPDAAMQRTLREVFAAQGLAEPDFDRLTVVSVRLDSPEFAHFEASYAAGPRH